MAIKWNRSVGWNIDLIQHKKNMNYTIIKDGAGCYPWTQHFAWLPVTTITGSRVWGIKLYRRKVWVVWGTGFHMEPETQYATILEILANDGETI